MNEPVPNNSRARVLVNRTMRLQLALVLLLASGTSHATEQSSATAWTNSHAGTFRSATDLVLVDVTAINAASGAPETHLKQSEFEIFDNGHVLPIRTFDTGLQSRPLALWFIVQCNMQGWGAKGSGLFTARTHLLAPALHNLNRTDRVAVAHWCDDGGSQIDLTPTGDHRQATQTLERVLAIVHPQGSHGRLGELALQKTLQSIIDTTRALPEPAIPVVLFLYGDWSAMPRSEASHFVDALLATTAIVFGIRDIHSPQMRELDWLGGEQPSVANYLAEQTGGQYFRVSSDDYGTALDRILTELHSRYELGFEPRTLDGRRHTLRVRLIHAGNVKNGKVRLRYRSGYVSLPHGTQ